MKMDNFFSDFKNENIDTSKGIKNKNNKKENNINNKIEKDNKNKIYKDYYF